MLRRRAGIPALRFGVVEIGREVIRLETGGSCRFRIEEREGVLIQPTSALRGREATVGKHLQSLIPGKALAVEREVMDTFAMLVEEFAHDCSAIDGLHDL